MLMWASSVSAQKPDFSGKWTVDQEKTQAANPQQQGGGGGGGRGGAGGGGRGGMGGGMGAMTITLDASSMTVEREGPQGAIKTVYKLDGSASQVSMGPMTGSAKAKVDGATIVVEQTLTTQNGERQSTAVYSVEGEHLVVATTQPGRDGAATTRKVFYKKG
jgi:hypothetical protein